MSNPTQKQRVLQILRDAGDRGVHSFEFLEAGMPRAAARIGELRADGWTITSTIEVLNGDAKGARYRLILPSQILCPDLPLGEAFDIVIPGRLPRPHWQDAA